jgi:hypothetical protein
MSGKRRNIWVVILAGGDGQRLRPLTTNARGISTPSDHHVEHEAVLTLLGMSPYAPDSGFGYLSPAPDSGVGMRPVLDSGIIAGRISQFIALYPRHMRQVILN